SLDAEDPVRLEFFGDEVDSIRPFSVGSQRSLGDVREEVILGQATLSPCPSPPTSGGEDRATGALSGPAEMPPSDPATAAPSTAFHLAPAPPPSKAGGEGFQPASPIPRGHLTERLPPDSWVVLVEPAELHEQGKFFLETVASVEGLFTVEGTFQQLVSKPNVTVSALPRPGVEAIAHLRVESVERFSGNVNRVRDELDAIARQDRVLIVCHNEAEVHRLTDVLAAGQLAQNDRLKLVTGSVRAGFRLVESGVVVLGSHELFHREMTPAGQKDAPLPRRRIES